MVNVRRGRSSTVNISEAVPMETNMQTHVYEHCT